MQKFYQTPPKHTDARDAMNKADSILKKKKLLYNSGPHFIV
jgi:hypothetical protein